MKDKIWIKYYKQGVFKSEFTFVQAEQQISIQVKVLKSLGIKSGDRVIVKYENSPELIFIYFALYKIKAVVIPVHYKEDKDRLMFILKDSNAVGVLSQEGFERSKKLKDGFDYKIPKGVCTIIYTSGTTAAPKGVCLTMKNWHTNAKCLIRHHNFNSKTIFASPLLLSHCNAHGLAMFSTYLAKSTYVVFDTTPKNFLEIIKNEKVQVVSLVPAILHQLLQDNQGWKKYKELKYILTAAAPLSAELLSTVIKRWSVRVIQGFGLSESTNFTCTLPIDLSDAEYNKIMFPYPSVGVSLYNTKITIGENKEAVVGELEIFSDSNFSGYWKKDILRKQKKVFSGDLGYFKIFNNKKFYYLCGRIKEIINRGGEKFLPLEIEMKIRKLGLQSEFAVFGMPDEKYGEEIAIAATSPFDENILEQLPKYLRPKKVFYLEKLFYTPTGKLQRKKITEAIFNTKA